MKILANEPLTCVAGEDVYEVLQSYQADELHAFISQHAADQYAGLVSIGKIDTYFLLIFTINLTYRCICPIGLKFSMISIPF